MRAASLPRFQLGPLTEGRHVLWYALLLGLVLLGCAALLAAVVASTQPAEPQLLAPFRWMVVNAIA